MSSSPPLSHYRPFRVPACLAIIPHQSLKAFDWNKQLRVISQVQITLIQARVAKAGHDWVISQPVTLFITVNHCLCSWSVRGQELMNGGAQCAFQFLTSLLISSGQIVQYLTLIYFMVVVPHRCVWGRRRGEITRGRWVRESFLFTKNSLLVSVQELLFLYRMCK